MPVQDHHYVSEAEFLRWPPSKQKIELVDGEVVVSPSATWRHHEVSERLWRVLAAWCERHPPLHAAQGNVDIRFGRDRILQPDLFVLPEDPPLDVPMPLQLVPRLCVEILSTDVGYDRRVKRLLYAAAGVPEYWVIDPHGGAEVFHGEGLVQRIAVTDTLHAATLPELVVDVAALVR